VVDLVNRLETETRNGRQGRLADLSSSIAALCLSTCGDTRLDRDDGHLSLAACTYLASRDWTLSALSWPPCMRRLDRLMTEPQCDHGAIYARTSIESPSCCPGASPRPPRIAPQPDHRQAGQAEICRSDLLRSWSLRSKQVAQANLLAVEADFVPRCHGATGIWPLVR
jgi:hypothetical protein